MSKKPISEAYEARAHFEHDGEHKRPGDIVDLTEEQAVDLESIGFVVRAIAYGRRDMKAKG